MGGGNSKALVECRAAAKGVAGRDELRSYKLKANGFCTGMFWRDAPAGRTHRLSSGDKPDWPRNGTILRGYVHDVSPNKVEDNDLWLEVMEMQSPIGGKAIDTPNCWMPFEQGGLILHASE